MSGKKSEIASTAGTALSPQFYEGPFHIEGDVSVRIRYFAYQTDEGLVSGRNTNEIFTIDRPAKEVWPFVKNFSSWHGSYGYVYSGVVGDLEGKSFRISAKLKRRDVSAQEQIKSVADIQFDDKAPLQHIPYSYDVIRVVPEHLIVISQPVPEDGSTGGFSPGFHVIMLSEREGKTLVTMYTEHAHRTTDKTVDEALASYRDGEQESMRRFRDFFIPELKRLVYESAKKRAG